MYNYAVRLKREAEGGFTVVIPAFSVYTQGETVADSLRNAQDALDEAIAQRIGDELEIPAADGARARYSVEASPYLVLKAALYEAMRKAGVSKNRLARRLDVGETEVRRMLDPRHATKFQRLTDALAALGVRVRVSVEPLSRKAA